MAGIFPSEEWLESLREHLNTDEEYARIARKWEGDLVFDITPSGALKERNLIYLDLWHGQCRNAYFLNREDQEKPAFILQATFDTFVRVLTGKLDPMQAMMTRKLRVKGSMGYIMRNVPTVLKFVSCAQDVTDEVLGD